MNNKTMLGQLLVIALLTVAGEVRAADTPAEALYHEAIAAQTGKGATLDLAKGKALLLQAAEAGSGRAMSRLGDMYRIPDGGAPVSLAEARRWYDKAAAANDPFGLLWSANLDDHTLTPEETNQRYIKAQEVARKLALTDPTAVFVVGMGYVMGHGVPKDMQTGMEALQQAAGDGEPNAMRMIASGYAHGDVLPKDPQKAYEWYAKAAESGFSIPLMELGICYDAGIGVPRDYAQAFKYYLQAADRGSARNMTNAAQMFADGQGTAPDVARAVELFQKAADLGWFPAMYYLGMFYETGKGVTADHDKALQWIRKAAAGQNPKAKQYLMDHHLPAQAP